MTAPTATTAPARRTRRPARFAAAVLLAAVPLLGACAGTAPPAAEVNGVEISQADLDEELENILGNEQYMELLTANNVTVRGRGEGTFDAAFVAQVLSRQILLELVHQDVEKRNLELTKQDLDLAAEEVAAQISSQEAFEAFPAPYRERLIRRNAEITALQEDVADVDVTDAAVAAFYEENADRFGEVCVRHILVDDKATADALRAQIVGGADFATLARESSTDEGSGAQGGELASEPGKCLSNEEAEGFVPEFLAAMEALEPGQLSEPVQTEFGFHLIEVKERRTRPLEEVADEIRERLLQNTGSALVEHIDVLLDAARITVDDRYGRFERCGEEKQLAGECQQPGVIPPEAPELPTTTTTGLPGSDLGIPLPGGGSAPPSEGPPAEAEADPRG